VPPRAGAPKDAPVLPPQYPAGDSDMMVRRWSAQGAAPSAIAPCADHIALPEPQAPAAAPPP